MINENQQNQTTDAQDLNQEIISTVTATVLQTLKATGTKLLSMGRIMMRMAMCSKSEINKRPEHQSVTKLEEKQMINENQQNQTTDAQVLNQEIISTVTATVLQTLKATGQISGESKEHKNNRI